MKLEEEIKQERFQSSFHRLGINLIYTANWFNNQVARAIKSFDITPQQFNVLRILKGQNPKPVSVLMITERMLDKMSNASRLVEKLRQKGLVDRQECQGDRRLVDIIITDRGLDLLEKANREVEAIYDLLKKVISEEQALSISNLLDEILD